MSDWLIPAIGDDLAEMKRLFAQYRDAQLPFRQTRAPQQRFISLAELVSTEPLPSFSYNLLAVGLGILKERLSEITRDYLPPERCMVGVADPSGMAFGGFHTPDHGYRHLEQLSVSSVLGAFAGSEQISEVLRAADLLRAIAHDSIHHSSYRIYRVRRGAKLRDGSVSDVTFRWQYGVNFRREDGLSYSARDPGNARSTRNLGVIMDAVTDRFARTVVRDTLISEGIAVTPEHSELSFSNCVLTDVCGDFDESTLLRLKEYLLLGDNEVMSPLQTQYLESMRQFHRYVTVRWAHFCQEFGQQSNGALFDMFLQAIVTGRLASLSGYLNQLTGKAGTFRELFLQERFRIQRG